METKNLKKYTLRYYLGVYFTSDNLDYFKEAVKKYRKQGWNILVNGIQYTIETFLNFLNDFKYQKHNTTSFDVYLSLRNNC